MEHVLATLSLVQGLSVFAAILVVAIVLAVWSVRKTYDSLARLAGELNLQLVAKPPVFGVFRRTPRVEGNVAGRNVCFFQYSEGTQKNRRSWSAVAVTCRNPHGFTLRLCRQSILTDLGVKLGGLVDLQIGDPGFDEKFVIQTNAPEYLRAALLPELRETLLREWPTTLLAATLKIEGGRVLFSDAMPFSDARVPARMKALLPVLSALAVLPEVYSPQGAKL